MEHIQREIEDERRSRLNNISHFAGVGSLGGWGGWGVPAGLTSSGHGLFPIGRVNTSPRSVVVHMNFEDLMLGLSDKSFAPQIPTDAMRTIDRSKVRTLRQREIEWRRTHPEVLRQFENKWVVLEGQEIIAHGEDAADVIKAARSRGIKKPYVFFVEPKDENVIMYGL